MAKCGFTLVELVVAIAIILILTTIGTLQFSYYVRKNKAESEIRQLYADIMELRSRSLFEKRIGVIKLGTGSYSIYPTEDTSGSPYATKMLVVPVVSNNASDIVFSTRGLFGGANNKTICISESNAAPVDSIVMSATGTQLGKREEGAICEDGNIVPK